jgi:hypothetical protein
MPLLRYTSYDEIRAVLGVSATELTDEALNQPMYDTHALIALDDVVVGIPTVFDTFSELSVKTEAQTRFIGLVCLYVPYAIAKQLLTSLPMFGIQQLTDGRAGFQRNSNAAIYDSVRTSVQLVLGDIKLRLAVSYYGVTDTVAVSSSSVTQVFAISTGILRDPVTNL